MFSGWFFVVWGFGNELLKGSFACAMKRYWISPGDKQNIGSLFFWKIWSHKTTKFLKHIWNCVMSSQDHPANIYHEGNHHGSLTFEYFWSSESSVKGISTFTT